MRFCFSASVALAIFLSGGLFDVPKGLAFMIATNFKGDATRERQRCRFPFRIDSSNRKHAGSIHSRTRQQSSNSDDDNNSSTRSDEIPNDANESQNTDPFSDCEEEGECEINWDLMPGYIDSDEENNSNRLEKEEADKFNSETVTPTAILSEEDMDDDDDDDDDLEINADDIADKLRTRFEMQWKMTEQTEECDVYKPVSCGGMLCDTCNGTGVCTCRFCRGTGFIYMKLPSASTPVPRSRGEQLQLQFDESIYGGTLNSLLQEEPSSSFNACNICEQKGHETCRQCRGSGWIADWTSTNINSGLKP